ncbi:DUF3558 family protein [Gordonia sp. NB41Y]|uniref:DUF3558 family protein n=1 Tax=Gordonia sp. NB41Y TaxID=875808 RepID=UPI0006B22D29|nr:DUF3558 family protein [Gordonia sp. NB41Y]EMP10937.2 RNA-binding protein S4 [Gordonia sp. NB41Y]WLP92014.1 DUF3558 family protein [Gordonia sp. NB41Y]
MASIRVDSWIWAIRLTKTRSAAGAACRAGHVRVNDVTAKPAQHVAVGDRVQVRLDGRERIVEVTKLIAKRVSAPLAAECYIDHSPPPPPREIVASQPRRDRGAGRPTKRERRDLDRFRSTGGLLGLIVTMVAVALLFSSCSSGSDSTASGARNTPEAPGPAGGGPFFGECGGVTTEEVSRLTGFGAMTLNIDNPSACEWGVGISRTGAVASFNWYRGSPIGRERATEQLSRESTTDIDISGHKGFIAYDTGICEIGIAFGADFFEWSLSRGLVASGEAADTQAICDAAKQLATMSIERAK